MPDITLWHLRLGQLSHDRLLKVNKLYDFIRAPCTAACNIFHLSSYATAPFHLVHMIFRVHMQLLLFMVLKISLLSWLIILAITCFIWVVIMRATSEIHSCISSFYNLVETQFSKRIKAIHSENGPAFFLKTVSCLQRHRLSN